MSCFFTLSTLLMPTQYIWRKNQYILAWLFRFCIYLEKSACARRLKFLRISSFICCELWQLLKEISFTLPFLFNSIHELPLGVCSNRVGIHTKSSFLCLPDVLSGETGLSSSLLLIFTLVFIVALPKMTSKWWQVEAQRERLYCLMFTWAIISPSIEIPEFPFLETDIL